MASHMTAIANLVTLMCYTLMGGTRTQIHTYTLSQTFFPAYLKQNTTKEPPESLKIVRHIEFLGIDT